MQLSSPPLAVLALFLCPTLLVITSCEGTSSDVIGTAYVAPATLNLHRDLKQKNTVGVLLKHGERVDILDVRRRFVRIRTAKGDVGWVDSLQLLSPDQMANVEREMERALKRPSEGTASVYEPLNIHINPSRQSPAFATIPQGGVVSVLAHRAEPKTTEEPKPPNLVPERPQLPAHRSRKEKVAHPGLHLPPMPAAPSPPANWQELSAERIGGSSSTADRKAEQDEKAAERKAAALKRPLIMENWTLVRTKDNRCGWVLSRNLVMLIPDEVAQYAEGRRITSFFDLGAVNDEEKGIKHNWLWTTLSRTASYDFDGWRVFLWNRRRHRYETSYRQRDLEGYFPVHVEPPDATAFGRSFELITKDDDGRFRRRTYLFDGVRVHLTATEDYRPGVMPGTSNTNGLDTSQVQTKASAESWWKRKWRALKARVTGQHQVSSIGPCISTRSIARNCWTWG